MGKSTAHGRQRLKQRLGINKKSKDKVVERALANGIPHKELRGALKEYIGDLYKKQYTANNIKIYGENVFIFKDDLLITVFHLPNRYKKFLAKIKRGRTDGLQASESS